MIAMMKNRMYYLLLLCLLGSVFCFNIQAQNKPCVVKGTILNQKGLPISFATVAINNTGNGTVTDAQGTFQLATQFDGKAGLTIRSMGYKQKTITINLKKGKNINIFETLEESTQDIDEIVVSTKSKSTLIKQKGFAVNTVETKGASLQSVQSNELLDRMAGIQVKQEGGLGSRLSYNLNGLSGNAIRFFIDGIPMDYFGPSYSLSSIPPSSINRIEVYKGVVPVKLGNDALGGAVNIATKDDAKNGLDFSYSIGSFNTHQASINGVRRDNKTGFTIKGNAFYNYSDNNYTVKDVEAYDGDPALGRIKRIDAQRFNDGYLSYGGKFDIGFTGKKWADKLLFNLVFSHMDKEIQTGSTMEVVYGEREYNSSTIAPGINYIQSNFLTEGLDINLFTMYSHLTRQIVDTTSQEYDWSGRIHSDIIDYTTPGEAGDPTLNEDIETSLINRINITYQLNHQLKLGANYIRTDFNRSGDDVLLTLKERELLDDKGYIKNVAGLTVETNELIPGLTSSFFIKYYNLDVNALYRNSDFNNAIEQEHVKNNYKNTGFGMASSYKIFKDFIGQFSIENGVRLPESEEIFGNNTENITTNYNLKPERSLNANMGFNYSTSAINKHYLSFITNFFYRNTKDMIRQANSVSDEDYAFENLDDVLSTGVDLDLNYMYNRKLSIKMAMSVLNARFNTQYDENGAAYSYYKDRLRNEPYFHFNYGIKYSLENIIFNHSQTNISYGAKYIHEYFRNYSSSGSANKDMIPSQLSHNVGINISFPQKNYSISLDAKNIFNETLYDNFALQKPGRAIFFKINYSIH
ncbi:outer membrane cobalamin translocator [Saccharicrinis fermentans DSM 9555 = JCM 21142]|uniref:Outer membrane cobalamin translocator n=2 Tax=Saccharicrinis fermentans TaxID=982 RepID=W7Y357_9BACT|nr:outer membrane cobalamin translocator [Saccharicrinis fermentans DSM 9555 = JCM 21142]